MTKAREYRFRIDAYSPSTIPMARLAEYMATLADLFGYESSVHFVALEEGSTVLVQSVEHEDVPKVEARVRAVRMHEGPSDAMKAYNRLDKKLFDDNAVGSLIGFEGAEIIHFPGRQKPKPQIYGPIKQQGSIDGMLFRLGGKDNTVPVHLLTEDDVSHACNTNREIARLLAPCLFRFIRVHGQGRWHRDEQGSWNMDRFDIKDFEVLQDNSLTDVVQQLRGVQGSAWKKMNDPLAELRRIRNGSDEVH